MNLLILETPLLILLTVAQQFELGKTRLQQPLHFRLMHQEQGVNGGFGTARRIRIGRSNCLFRTSPKVNVCLLSLACEIKGKVQHIF